MTLMSTPAPLVLVTLTGALGTLGCNQVTSTDNATQAIVPADYKSTFTEVRGCRKTGVGHEGDLFIRVLAGPSAKAPYTERKVPFPEGAVVVKEQFDDEKCQTLVQLTAMRKEAKGYDPTASDWHWQTLGADRAVKLDGKVKRCIGCHADAAGECNGGYDLTCTAP